MTVRGWGLWCVVCRIHLSVSNRPDCLAVRRFVCQAKTKRGKLETVAEVLYISGQPPAGNVKAKKVDGWSRLEQMGPSGEQLSDGSLLVVREVCAKSLPA